MLQEKTIFLFVFSFVLLSNVILENLLFKKFNADILTCTKSILFLLFFNFLFTDLFLCDSFKVYNFFSRVFPHYLSKLAYWGSLNYEKKMLVKKKHLRKIIYFTQPYELNEQVRFVNFLISETIKRDIHLYIKPHPREDIKRLLSNIEQHVIVLPKSYSIEDYSNCCDLAILRTSSITQDLILEGIPVLNVLISNFDRTVKLDFLNPLGLDGVTLSSAFRYPDAPDRRGSLLATLQDNLRQWTDVTSFRCLLKLPDPYRLPGWPARQNEWFAGWNCTCGSS